MSDTAAREFLSRVEADQAFAAELEALKDDPSAVLAKVHAAGFDFSPDEVRAELLVRYGDQLRPEQLDDIAAGADMTGAIVSSGIGIGAGVSFLAFAAAASLS
jgi:predicted ribosomally synthesized peptide with nif11-like leader